MWLFATVSILATTVDDNSRAAPTEFEMTQYMDRCRTLAAKRLTDVKEEIRKHSEKLKDGKKTSYSVGSKEQIKPKKISKTIRDEVRKLGDERDKLQKPGAYLHDTLSISWRRPSPIPGPIGVMPRADDPWHVVKVVDESAAVVCKLLARETMEPNDRASRPTQRLEYFTWVDGVKTKGWKLGDNVKLPHVFYLVGVVDYTDDRKKALEIPRVFNVDEPFQEALKVKKSAGKAKAKAIAEKAASAP